MNKTKRIEVITGNLNKAREISEILSLEVVPIKTGKKEIQGSLAEIVKAKIGERESSVPIIADDTGLFLDCLNGLPGPYIAHFIDAIGNKGLHKIARLMGNMKARADCAIALKKPGDEIEVFEASCKGTIVEPRGSSDFGWDPIFVPEGHVYTFAEMNPETKNEVSHRALAMRKLKAYLDNT